MSQDTTHVIVAEQIDIERRESREVIAGDATIAIAGWRDDAKLGVAEAGEESIAIAAASGKATTKRYSVSVAGRSGLSVTGPAGVAVAGPYGHSRVADGGAAVVTGAGGSAVAAKSGHAICGADGLATADRRGSAHVVSGSARAGSLGIASVSTVGLAITGERGVAVVWKDEESGPIVGEGMLKAGEGGILITFGIDEDGKQATFIGVVGTGTVHVERKLKPDVVHHLRGGRLLPI